MTNVHPSSITEKIQQTKPFKAKRQEALVAIFRTTDMLRSYISRHLQEHDITPQQYNVLRILRGAGSEGLPTLSISERMIERTPGITRLLNRLEKRGLAVRRRCTEDRRRVYCEVTPEGKRLLSKLDPATDLADEAAMSGVSDARLDDFILTLSRIREGVREEQVG